MVRTVVIAALMGAFALPGLAAAEQLPASPQGMEIVADDGTSLGRVGTVERNGRGQVVSVAVEGLEPDDAPAASSDLVASNEPYRLRIRYTPEEAQRRSYNAPQTRIR
jgi:hypothetical protein